MDGGKKIWGKAILHSAHNKNNQRTNAAPTTHGHGRFSSLSGKSTCALACAREREEKEQAAPAAATEEAAETNDEDGDDAPFLSLAAVMPKKRLPTFSRPSQPTLLFTRSFSIFARAHALRPALVYELACERKAAPGRGENEEKIGLNERPRFARSLVAAVNGK